MSNPDAPVLLFGPYHPPALRRGDRVIDLVRGAMVVITSWSDARLSWPRCRTLGHRGGSGLLVEDELARAIRGESALALMYWWGVTCSTVWNWRIVLGVEGRAGAPGSQRLIQAAAEKAGEAMANKALFPPLIVFFDGTHFWLADGFHRVAAALKAGLTIKDSDHPRLRQVYGVKGLLENDIKNCRTFLDI